MAIQERNLPVAESLDEGAMVRIIDGEGHSKNINADEIGGSGGVLIVNVTLSDGIYITDKTFGEIRQAFDNGNAIIFIEDGSDEFNISIRKYTVTGVYYSVNSQYESIDAGVVTSNQSFNAETSGITEHTLDALDKCYLYYN